MHWSAPYVGLPWAEKGSCPNVGVSCWGLIGLVYRERLGIALPSYADDFQCSQERAEVAAIIDGATTLGPWRERPLPEARPFDVVVFTVGGIASHVGLVVEPGRMLHITRKEDSAVADYTSSRWCHRLSGLYRHEALAA